MTSPSLRVLHVIASLAPVHGGTTAAVLQMIAGLDELGVACAVATSDDDGPRRRLADDAIERHLPGRHYFPKRRDFYVHTPSMGHWLDAHVRDFDLVHIHGLFSYVNGLAGRICRRHRVPYVVTPHGMANRYGMRHKRLRKAISFSLIERSLLEGAAAVHMTSRGEEHDFADLRVSVPVVRIPLAVAPVALGDGAVFQARHPEVLGRKLAIFIGRLNPIKNLGAVIDALALPAMADWHLAVCGDGPVDYVRALKEHAEARGVAQRITWLGFIAGQEKANVLAAGDVYVQPSLSESFGMAAVEAVSAGLPCVLGEEVAIAEDLVTAGFAITTPYTVEGVAHGMQTCFANQRDDGEYSRRARAFVATSFAPASVSAALREFYGMALASR